jgi:hypothetical protein
MRQDGSGQQPSTLVSTIANWWPSQNLCLQHIVTLRRLFFFTFPCFTSWTQKRSERRTRFVWIHQRQHIFYHCQSCRKWRRGKHRIVNIIVHHLVLAYFHIISINVATCDTSLSSVARRRAHSEWVFTVHMRSSANTIAPSTASNGIMLISEFQKTEITQVTSVQCLNNWLHHRVHLRSLNQ